jgi:hypothetical protein
MNYQIYKKITKIGPRGACIYTAVEGEAVNRDGMSAVQ